MSSSTSPVMHAHLYYLHERPSHPCIYSLHEYTPSTTSWPPASPIALSFLVQRKHMKCQFKISALSVAIALGG